jgi:hypothetical protein
MHAVHIGRVPYVLLESEFLVELLLHAHPRVPPPPPSFLGTPYSQAAV